MQHARRGSSGISIPGVVSETPAHYRKQQRFEANDDYLVYTKTAAETEAEVDYEMDADDEQWLRNLMSNGSVRRHPLTAHDMEVMPLQDWLFTPGLQWQSRCKRRISQG